MKHRHQFWMTNKKKQDFPYYHCPSSKLWSRLGWVMMEGKRGTPEEMPLSTSTWRRQEKSDPLCEAKLHLIDGRSQLQGQECLPRLHASLYPHMDHLAMECKEVCGFSKCLFVGARRHPESSSNLLPPQLSAGSSLSQGPALPPEDSCLVSEPFTVGFHVQETRSPKEFSLTALTLQVPIFRHFFS